MGNYIINQERSERKTKKLYILATQKRDRDREREEEGEGEENNKNNNNDTQKEHL